VKLSSAVICSSAVLIRSSAGRSKVRRKYRVPAGAEFAGSPSGYQIQLASAKDSAGDFWWAPIHSPWKSPGLTNAVSNHAAWLQAET
jgi:hypothetical protein